MEWKSSTEARAAELESRKAAQALVDAAKSENRDLTEDETAQVDKHLDTADAAKAAFDTLTAQDEASEARAARLDANRAALDEKPKPKSRMRIPGQAVDAQADEIEHVKMFGRYLTGGEISGREQEKMRPKSERWSAAAQKGMVMPAGVARAVLGLPMSAIPHLSTDADGGANLFDREYIAELSRLAPEATSLLGRVRVLPTMTGDVRIPRLTQTDENEYGGVAFDWTGEGGQKPETEAKFDQVPIATHEAAGYTEVSHTLMRRSVFDIVGLIGELFRDGMRDFMERAIISGSGTGQALGIVNTAGVRTIARTTAGEVGYEDLVAMKYAILPQHRDSAVWLLQDDSMGQLELIVDLLNRPLFRASIDSGPVNRLIGYPFITSTRLPAATADASVWFMDPRQYWLAVEQEIVVRSSEHFKFRNNLEALSVFACFGGRLVQPRSAVKLTATGS